MVNTDDAVFVVFCGPITAEEMEVRRKLGLFKNPDRDIDDNLDFDWFQESSAHLKGHNLSNGATGRRKTTSKSSPLRSAKSNLNSSYQQTLLSSPSSIYSPSDATISDISIQDQTETCQPSTSTKITRSRSFLSFQDSSPHIVNKSVNVDISKSGLNTKTNKRKRSFSTIPDEPIRKTLRSIHSSLLILDKNQLSTITKSNKNLNCSMLNKLRKTSNRVQNTDGSSHMGTISGRSLLQQTSNSVNQLPLKSHSSLQLGEDSDLTNNSRSINDTSIVSNSYLNFNPEETKGKECTCISLNSSLFNSQTQNLSKINRTVSYEQSLSPRGRHKTELPRLDTLEKSVDDPKAKLLRKRSLSSLSHLTPTEKKVIQANTILNDSLLKSFNFTKGKKPIKKSSEPLSVKKKGTFKIISPKKLSSSVLLSNKDQVSRTSRANKTMSDSLLHSQIQAAGSSIVKQPVKNLTSIEPLRRTSVKKKGSLKKISPKKLSSSVLSSKKTHVSRISHANKTMSDSLIHSQIQAAGSSMVKQSVKNLKSLVPLKKMSVKKNDSLKKVSPKKLSSSVLSSNKDQLSRASHANKTMRNSLLCGSHIKTAGSSIVKQPIKNLKSIEPVRRTSVKKNDTLKKVSPKKLSSSVLSTGKGQVSRASRANKTMSDSLLRGSQIKTAGSSIAKQPIKNLKSLPLKKMSVKKNDTLKKVSPKKLSSSVLSSNKDWVSRAPRANKTMSNSLLRGSHIKTTGSSIVKQPIKNLKSLVPLKKMSVKKNDSLKKVSPKKLSSSVLSSNKDRVSRAPRANKTMSNSLLRGSNTGSNVVKKPRKNSKSLVPRRKTSVKENASLLRKTSRSSRNASGSSSPVKPSKSKASVNKNNSHFLKSPTSPSTLDNDSISLTKKINSSSISMLNPNSSMFSPRETFHSFKNETNGSMSIFEKMNQSCSSGVTDFSLCCGDSMFNNSSSSTAGISKGVNQLSWKESQLSNPTKNIDDLAKPRRKLLANKSLNELIESSGTKFKRTMRQNKTLNESILKRLMLKERKSPVEQKILNSVIADESLVKNKTKGAFLRNFNLPLKKEKGMESLHSLQDSLISLASSKSYTFTPDKDDRSRRKTTEASMDTSMAADGTQEIDKNMQITPNTSKLHPFLPDKENFMKSTNSHSFTDNEKPKTPKRSTSNEEGYSHRSSISCENNSATTRQNSSSKNKNVLNKPKLVVTKVNSDISWSKKLNRSKILKAQRPNYVYSPSRFIHKKQ